MPADVRPDDTPPATRPAPSRPPMPEGPEPTRTAPSLRAVAMALLPVALLWVPVLLLHLVAALLSALLVYGATRRLAAWMHRRWPALGHSDGLALALILVVVGIVVAATAEWLAHARQRPVSSLMDQMAQILDQLRVGLPAVVAEHVPESVEALRQIVVDWLKGHSAELRQWGGHAARNLGHAVIGIVLGAMLALGLGPRPHPQGTPLEHGLRSRFDELVDNFITVVFAQGRIALLNAALTALYLLVILPLAGRPLPMAGTLVVITFLCGLIPVFGNLISNAVIVVLSLSDSVLVAAMSLAWLVTIHKLEYVLNARIIGSRINARAWEMLMAMLVMEGAFGVAGLLTAPIVYAEIKQALVRRGWVRSGAAPH